MQSCRAARRNLHLLKLNRMTREIILIDLHILYLNSRLYMYGYDIGVFLLVRPCGSVDRDWTAKDGRLRVRGGLSRCHIGLPWRTGMKLFDCSPNNDWKIGHVSIADANYIQTHRISTEYNAPSRARPF
jgi:hypothetical protein